MPDDKTEREKQYEQLVALHQQWAHVAHALAIEIRDGRVLPADHGHRVVVIQNLVGLIGMTNELLGQLTEEGAEELRQLLVQDLQQE